jgi:REP element-mobilizing transposase RayT
MARPRRIECSGGLYHVTARGNGRQPIVTDDADCERFLAVLASVVERYHVLCHAYCLMGNHYHLLLETPEANLSRAMRQLNGVYSQGFNRQHRRAGHVLEGRFHAQLVDGEAYLHAVCRYIVLNPVRAGLVAHPRQWAWSSYRATAGEGPAPPGLTLDWVLALGGTPARAEAQRRYRQFVEAGMGEGPEPLEAFQASLVVGEAARLAPLSGRAPEPPSLGEIPRAQRFAPRPALAALFAGVTSRRDRDARCVHAVRQHGYSLTAVARCLGLHYATVSRVLAREAGRGRAWPASDGTR